MRLRLNLIPNPLALILNPKTWIIGAIIAFGIWLAVMMHQNSEMKLELQAQEATISELQVTAETLKQGQALQAADLARLDSIAQYKQTVIIREQNLDNDLAQIPETADAPFSDPNNLAYASRLRDYQEQTLSELTANQPD